MDKITGWKLKHHPWRRLSAEKWALSLGMVCKNKAEDVRREKRLFMSPFVILPCRAGCRKS